MSGVVNHTATTFGSQMLHVGTSLVSLFAPLLMIDIANLISDFDTAPTGTPEPNTILTMSPSTF